MEALINTSSHTVAYGADPQAEARVVIIPVVVRQSSSLTTANFTGIRIRPLVGYNTAHPVPLSDVVAPLIFLIHLEHPFPVLLVVFPSILSIFFLILLVILPKIFVTTHIIPPVIYYNTDFNNCQVKHYVRG